MDDLYGTDLYSEDERKRAQREFWQTLAFSMLANPYRGQEMQALGRAGLAGMNAREDSLVRSQRARLTKGQLERYELDNREAKQRQADLEEQRALRMRYLQGGVPAFSGEDREGNPVDYPSQPAREDWVGYQRALASINPAAAIQLEPFARRQAVRQALAGGPSGPPGAPGSYPGTSTPSASVASPRDPGFEPASLPGGPPTPFPTSLDKVTLNRAIATRLMGDAEKLRGAGLVEEADAMIARAASLLPQYDKTPRVGVDPATGKRVQFVLDNEGNPKLLPIGPDLEKLVNVDTGSVIQGRDPYTNEPRGPAIPKSVTPGERASNAVAWYNATKPQVIDGQLVTIGKGGAAAAPIEGFQKPLDATTRRQIAESNVQLGNIDRALDLAIASPGAFGPQNYVGDMAMQYVDPSGTDARAAVANVGSKEIHDRAGAAVTIAEAPRLRPFVPDVRDKPDVVVRKLRLLKAEEAAMIAELKRPGASIESVANAKPTSKLPLAGEPLYPPNAIPRAGGAPTAATLADVEAEILRRRREGGSR